MSELQSIARPEIHDGKLEKLRGFAAKWGELVRTRDTGTLRHELLFNNEVS